MLELIAPLDASIVADGAKATSLCVASRRTALRRLEIFMNRDPRFALSQELEAKQTLLDQLRALAAEDPDFLISSEAALDGVTLH